MEALVAVSVLALVLTFVVVAGAFAVLRRAKPLFVAAVGSYLSAPLEAFGERLAALEAEVDALPGVMEGIKTETRKIQDRAYARVRRNRKELASRGLEDPELGELELELQRVDAEGSGDGRMLEMPEGMESPQQGVLPIRSEEDWQTETMRYKHG